MTAHSLSNIKSLLERHTSSIPMPRVVTTGNHAVPMTLLHFVDECLPQYILHGLNLPKGIPDRDEVKYETAFVGPGMRKHPDLHYIPARLSQVPMLFHTTRVPDVVLLHTSTPVLRDGVMTVSLGIEVNVMPAAIEACKKHGGLVLAQMNPNMPYTHGDTEFALDDLDGVVEVDEAISGTSGMVPPTLDDTTAIIGERVATRVQDGATMQLGIGEVPDATLQGLVARKNLGVWTEMFSDGVLALNAAGALDADRPLNTSFVFGSEALYEWLNHNERVRVLRTETINNPANIALQPGMTSVNTALQVDLFAQANASRIHARIHSGFGGQTDFIVGALHAHGGQALMALRSWHPKANVSTIVPMLNETTTSFQHTAIITEQGVAEVFAHDEKTQAKALIEQTAHPDAREELWMGARMLGLA